jgi:hypothetical protein
MIRVMAKDLEKLRLEIDQIATTAFWLETYAMGLHERAHRMKKYLLDLETVAVNKPGPETLPEE